MSIRAPMGVLLGVAALLGGAAVSTTGPAPATGGHAVISVRRTSAQQAVAYVPPVTPLQVVRAFEPPFTPYAAGHRGVDLATGPRATVRAAGPGTVTFSGAVAGRGVVVVVHPDGISTEYEPVAPAVRRGAVVAAGEPIAVVEGRHGECVPDRCLHWGARRGGEYLDPLTLLRPLGPVRLLPWPR